MKKLLLKAAGSQVGKKVSLERGNLFVAPGNLKIGYDVSIGKNNLFQSRDRITIGNHVNISGYSYFLTGSHNIDSPNFEPKYAPIKIEDYTWIGTNCTILPGVTVGEGAIVAAGSTVTKDVAPYTVVGGCPAKKIKDRPKSLNYNVC